MAERGGRGTAGDVASAEQVTQGKSNGAGERDFAGDEGLPNVQGSRGSHSDRVVRPERLPDA